MTKREELILLRRWQAQKDHRARDVLWAHVAGLLQPNISRWLGDIAGRDGQTVQDVLGDALFTAVSKVENGEFHPDGPARFSTFCLRVAFNKTRDCIRRHAPDQGKYEGLRQRGLVRDVANDAAAPDRVAQRREHRTLLTQAIAELPNAPKRPLRTIFCFRTGCRIARERFREVPKLTEAQIIDWFNTSQRVNAILS
jgi:DNA-directed RNA polymerase specialized sigma24 family protein